MSMYSHPHISLDFAEKPLIEVEEKTMQRVEATSELELKAKYPGVCAIS